MAGSYFNSRGIRSKFLHILDLISPIAIGPDEDGKLSAPMVTNTGNKPRRWVEIEPYVWKDLDSGEKLAAKVEDGQVNRWSFDTVSPFMMFDRAPWYKDPAWLAPALLCLARLAPARGACLAGRRDCPAPVQGCRTSTRAAACACSASGTAGSGCRWRRLQAG